MGNDDDEFKRLLKKFAAEHLYRTRSLEAHMNEAKKLIESDLADGGVHHTPISTRLKDQDKALETLERRYEARKELQKLKTMVEERGPERWEQYCKLWNMEDKVNEAEPFTSLNQMFEAMHDLAGLRVSLYFPDDVQKVVKLLTNRFEIVDGPTRKGGLTRDFQKIRKLVEEQRQGQGAVREGRGAPESPFGDYRATHMVIRHKHNFDKHARGDHTTNIEVQIGSIIMHAWSDIEHDILYKPTNTDKASPDAVRMLGLINGIVMTGEVALQQLASITAAESKSKAEDRTQKATGPRYLTPWLDQYFRDHKKGLPSNITWMSTNYLFDVLKATNEHSYGKLEELLNQMNPQPVNRLPVLVLHHIGRHAYRFQDSSRSKKDPTIVSAWSARYWATCLINTLNLATYMGSGPSVFDSMVKHTSKDKSLQGRHPTFAELLDVLHPTKVQRRHTHEGRIITYCRAMLATTRKAFIPVQCDGILCLVYSMFVYILIYFLVPPDSHGLAAMKLASAGYVARPRISEEEESPFGSNGPPILVPARLKRMDHHTLSTFRIMLSTIDEGLRSENEYLNFIPRLTEGGQYTYAWKPVIRQSGKWDITRAPFNWDAPIHFEEETLQIGPEVEHMLRALGVEMGAQEIRSLRKLAKTLHIDQDEDQLRLIVKLTRILGTTNSDKIQQFKQLLDAAKVEDDDEITMLAELDRSKETMELGNVKRYLQLSRSVHTKDLKELSVYRQLERDRERDRKTRYHRRLRELRDEQKNAERAQGQKKDSRLGDDLDDLDDSKSVLSDDRSAMSVEGSDNED